MHMIPVLVVVEDTQSVSFENASIIESIHPIIYNVSESDNTIRCFSS